MADMQLIVENGHEVKADLAQADRDLTLAVRDEATQEFAEELKEKLEVTSPVYSGTYKSNWELEEAEDGDGWLITNDTPYARYLVFPNTVMQGSPRADDPGRGILHNVRGYVFEERRGLRNKARVKIRRLIGR